MESARVDLQIVADQLTEDEVRLSTTPRSQRGPRLAGEARVDAGERAVAAARARLREREAEYDEAQQAFETADAAYDAQRQIWLDCLKTHIVATIPYANNSSGFTAGDYAVLNIILRHDYFIFDPLVTPEDVSREASRSALTEPGDGVTSEEDAARSRRALAAMDRTQQIGESVDTRPGCMNTSAGATARGIDPGGRSRHSKRRSVPRPSRPRRSSGSAAPDRPR